MSSVVAGGAGFLGSHLCEALLARGEHVLCLDDLSTGKLANLADCFRERKFAFLEADVTGAMQVPGRVDRVYHLASPASPRAYAANSVKTLKCGSHATLNLLQIADEKGAVFVLASTSEVYGNPEVHPQGEDYFGNVNPVGPRSMYDEAKRFAEALTTAFERSGRVRTAIARIFNTYGPRMRPDDGRVVPNFIDRALRQLPLLVYGNGEQTRSLCFVDDTVDALELLGRHPSSGPINVGSDDEHSISELAQRIVELTGSRSGIEHVSALPEDPARRRPDLSRVRELLNWTPRVGLRDGLNSTIAWHRTAGRFHVPAS